LSREVGLDDHQTSHPIILWLLNKSLILFLKRNTDEDPRIRSVIVFFHNHVLTPFLLPHYSVQRVQVLQKLCWSWATLLLRWVKWGLRGKQ